MAACIDVRIDSQGHTGPDVSIDALVSEVQLDPIAVEERPRRIPVEGAEHLGIAPDPEQAGHLKTRPAPSGRTTVADPEAVVSPRWLSARRAS